MLPTHPPTPLLNLAGVTPVSFKSLSIMSSFTFIAKANIIRSDFTSKSGKLIKARDSKGAQNIVLQGIDGVMPNRPFVAGTIAESLDIKAGKVYAMQYTEVEEHPEYGRQFQLSVISEMSAVDAYTLAKSSKLEVIDVNEAAPVAAAADDEMA